MSARKKVKPISKKFWDLLKYMPKFLRKRIIRSQFEINYDLSSDYVFKHAETQSEVEEAFQIVYESYTLLGYIDQRPEKIHFNAFLCLPTTTILIIKYKNEVIGTMSIVPDSAFGLPAEKTWDLSSVKSKDKNIAEISSLTIKKSHKSSKGHLLLVLCKIMYEYSTKILNLDGIVIAATEEVEPFYTDLLLFDKVVQKTGQRHSAVKGNKSTCCYLNFKKARKDYEDVYKNKKVNQNLSHFFDHTYCPNIKLPTKQLSIQGLNFKKNISIIKMLEKFPDLNKMFTAFDKLTVANLDPSLAIEKALNFDTASTTRIFPRISIRKIDAHLFSPKKMHTQLVQLVNVSKNGFGILAKKDLEASQLDEEFILLFELNNEAVSIHSKLIWNKNEYFGYLINEKSRNEWEKFIVQIFDEINLSTDYKRAV